MKPPFVRNRFVARRNLAFRDKAQELFRKGAESSQMIYEYKRGAPSYPTDVLPDGNQTRIKTATGIWTSAYNALNRPVTYTHEKGDGTRTVVTADYDYMGRRVFKKTETVTPDSESGEKKRTVITNHCFLYRGYLQIVALDLTRATPQRPLAHHLGSDRPRRHPPPCHPKGRHVVHLRPRPRLLQLPPLSPSSTAGGQGGSRRE